ncbi:Vps16, C-terminal region-domain-containing protein [Hyaloraphidium curvatum]|nr:Vps16, C-terminal region-domain-containing protein [Hyaloraphidium curvatum]
MNRSGASAYTSRVADSPPYLEWLPVGDAFFRRADVYDLQWKNVRLESMVVAAAPLAGPLAMIRNDRKAVVLQPNQPLRPTLSIYSLSGGLLHSTPVRFSPDRRPTDPLLTWLPQWERGRVVALGWSLAEQLVVVAEDGNVFLFDLFGTLVSQFSLGQDARDTTVSDCVVFGSGLVALTGNLRFISVSSFDQPRPRPLAALGTAQAPISWTVLPPYPGQEPAVFAAVEKTIYTVDARKAQNQLLSNGPFSKLAISPNGKFLATATDAKLWIVSVDFQRSLGEFPLERPKPPDQLCWCGTDAVAAFWARERTLMLASLGGSPVTLDMTGYGFLAPEVDGCRIITDDKCEFLQKVPSATESMFRIGSTSPGAVLYDALHDFENRRPGADEKIRLVKPNMTEAVDTCIEAAGYEVDALRQKAVLKAASFGKCFLEVYNSDRFVDMARILRVLNAVRDAAVGIPLTYPEYLRLTAELLVDRLVHRRLFFLALKICDYLGLKGERVVSSWACAKIRTSKDNEDTLSRVVLDRLSNVSAKYAGLSYADIAKEARANGRNHLAVKLLDMEMIPSNQVMPLLSMKEYDLALSKAMQSGDTDLVYSALLAIRRELPTAEFFRLLRNKPAAGRLFEVYCRQKDVQLLKDFYYQDDRRIDGARLVVEEYLLAKDPSEKIAKLRTIQKLYSEDKDSALEAKAAEDEIRLIQLQVVLEKELKKPFLDKTISGTILELIILGDQARALKVKNDFRVPEKRFAWLRLRGLIKGKHFPALRELSKSKSPIGFAPFVTELIDAGQPREAMAFVDRVEPSDKRIALQRQLNELLHQAHGSGVSTGRS